MDRFLVWIEFLFYVGFVGFWLLVAYYCGKPTEVPNDGVVRT